MPRRFNTAGPNKPELHFTLPAAERLPQVRQLVEQGAYFVLHAPRQVGKTTALLSLGKELTKQGEYVAVLVSMEPGAPFPHDPGAAELAVLRAWRARARARLPEALQPPPWPEAPPGARVAEALRVWAEQAPRPLVVFLDEIDTLQDEALLSVLRQLRDGYADRPEHFPWSLGLVGLRDVRDYRFRQGEEGRLQTASPFNIKSESLVLRDFSEAEVAALYEQHRDETGQAFSAAAVRDCYALTSGQPWLVNALARQLTEVVVTDRAQSLEPEHVHEAKRLLIARQDTHLDSLAERLREPRIQALIEPMLAGSQLDDVPHDDIQFACDLGLLRVTDEGGLDVANPIYREIIVDRLMFSRRASLPQMAPSWLNEKGQLDEQKLLQAFLSFWRQHGEPLMVGAPYHEVAPHLVLMAFLDRVANSGGSVEREYAIGRGRMDLCLRYGEQKLAIEIKLWREGRPDPLQVGIEQLDGYLAGLGLDHGWLVIFDRRQGVAPVAERVGSSTVTTSTGRSVTVVRG